MAKQRADIELIITSSEPTYGKSIDLTRVALTTIGYGLIGSLCDNTVPIAAVGCGAVVYDEITHKGMDMFVPAVSIGVGCLIGHLFTNSPSSVPSIASYVGGALGFYNSYVTRSR